MTERRQRDYAKAKLTRIELFLLQHTLESNTTAIQYQTKLEMLESAFQEFNLFHNEIINSLTYGTEEEHTQYYKPVEETYFQTKSTLFNYISARKMEFQFELVNNLNQSTNCGSYQIEVELPQPSQLSPPVFSADYNAWESSSNNIHSNFNASTTECPICTDQIHNLYHCPIFKEWDITSRRFFVNQNNFCFNCLLTTHTVSSCKSKYSCHECRKRHHTVLHITPALQINSKLNKHTTIFDSPGKIKHSISNQDYNSSTKTTSSSSQSIYTPQQTPKMFNNSGQSNTISSNQDYSSSNNKLNQSQMVSENSGNHNIQTNNHALKTTVEILLPTAVINTLDAARKSQEVRILFDSASQDSFLSEHCIQPLQLQREIAKNVSNGTNNSKGALTEEVSLGQFSRSRLSPDTKITLHPTVQLQTPESITINILINLQI